ncbi:uncharacterized protein CCOS01_15613 [Colletotrichum costaricense]|uniref:Uncharacterized protein n=1 Tax=Colletotrichum costaricense TaxID=1209916 RepID=A0AAI9YGN4_9PEZI|nr:uncharacterized protein CCOS01_15613 [Colletotrichum costaricense]KAK1509097.1 hypothetical protein CCOS01_15613 [Colletotrichum costaricense]
MCPAPAPATGVDPGLRYAGQTAGSIPQRLKGRRTLGIALGDLQSGLFTEPSFGPCCVTVVFPVKLCQVEMALGLRDWATERSQAADHWWFCCVSVFRCK